jgi:hypothetical protein
LAEKLLESHGSHSAWHRDHDHELHTATEMLASLREQFSRVDVMTVPYLYRYVCSILEDTERGYAKATETLALERRFSEDNEVVLIGRRFVAFGP